MCLFTELGPEESEDVLFKEVSRFMFNHVLLVLSLTYVVHIIKLPILWPLESYDHLGRFLGGFSLQILIVHQQTW